jgi:hypothetical protein
MLTTGALVGGVLDRRKHTDEHIDSFVKPLCTMKCRVLSLVAPGACGVEYDGLTSTASAINRFEMKEQSHLIRVADSILPEALYCSCLAPLEVKAMSSCGIEGQCD